MDEIFAQIFQIGFFAAMLRIATPLLFAFIGALQLRLQASAVIDVPYQFFPMMPFVLTIVAMALLSRNARVPAALLVPFRKEER